MYDSGSPEKNFKKLDVCVKHHESENALFLTIFLIPTQDPTINFQAYNVTLKPQNKPD